MRRLASRWFWRGVSSAANCMPAAFLLPGVAAFALILMLIFCETSR